jgi:small subunit ribosomal protein S18
MTEKETKTTAETAAPERTARAEGDRPQSTRPQGDRPQSARPQGGRPQGDRPRGRGARPDRRRKFCKFCADKSLTIDHKDPEMLRSFVTERYKILPSRVTGTCAQHQRSLTTAIKRARILALVAFTPLHHD